MKNYTIVYRINRQGSFTFYQDHHALVCFVSCVDDETKREEELGWERVNLGTQTKEGTYGEDYEPYISRGAFDMLVEMVSHDFPFEEEDEVTTHRGGLLNVSQYPLKQTHLDDFKKKLATLSKK